jgi:predicted nucleic acid-binding protein
MKSSRQAVPTVFFNASVILAGIRSPAGGSGTLLKMVRSGTIRGIISEIIVDECKRHVTEVTKTTETIEGILYHHHFMLITAPSLKEVQRYVPRVLDDGDAHVLASASACHAKYLVSLDKKHILAIKNNVSEYMIVSPGELLKTLREASSFLNK